MNKNTFNKMQKVKKVISTFQDWDAKKEMTMEATTFLYFAYPAKIAAEKAGLAFRAGCLHSKNNFSKCKYLFFPGEGSTFWRDGTQANQVVLKNIRIIQIEIFQEKPRVYRILPLYDELNEKTLQDLADFFFLIAKERSSMDAVTINKESLKNFFACYLECLIQVGIIKQDLLDSLAGWHVSREDKLTYLTDSAIVQSSNIPQISDELLPQIIYPAESIWFSASIFSLFKPLFRLCKVKCDIDFVVQVYLDSSTRLDGDAYKKGLWILEHQARVWCNYHEWPKTASYDNGIYPGKFRNWYHETPDLDYMRHKGFPIVLFNFEKRDDKTDDIEYFAKDNSMVLEKHVLKYLCTAGCLPILLPAAPSKSAYAKELCLTIPLNTSNSPVSLGYYAEDHSTLRERHENINSYYTVCMKALDGEPISKVSASLKKNYRKALAVLGIEPEKRDYRQEHLACMLGTLYFIRETLVEQKETVIRLNSRIHAFEKEIGIVTMEDFAAFIYELLQGANEKVIFGEDKDGIYLYYQKYWPAFRKYCKRNRIALSDSAASFRRNVLIPEGLIQPQYSPSAGSYARYDYRKKLNGEEATVLKLSPDILKEYR